MDNSDNIRKILYVLDAAALDEGMVERWKFAIRSLLRNS